MSETQDPEVVRSEIARERAQLADAVGRLRSTLDLNRTVGSRLGVAVPAVFGGAFILSGGVGATMRYLARRGRER